MTEFINTYATMIVVIGAAGAVLLGAWRKVARPLKAIGDIVEIQLKPNGGGSLVDKVSKIASNHIEAQSHWESLEKGNKEIAAALDQRTVVVDKQLSVINQRLEVVDQLHARVDELQERRVAKAESREMPPEPTEAPEGHAILPRQVVSLEPAGEA